MKSWAKRVRSVRWKESYLKYLILNIYFTFLMVLAITLLFVSNRVSIRSQEPIDQLMEINAIKVSISLTMISFVIVLISTIGCCASYTKSKLILVLFCILLVLLILIEVFSSYNCFYFNSKLKNEKIDDRFKDLTLSYVWNSGKSPVDQIQQTYQCCGTDSYHSWDPSRPPKLDPNSYPFSCCPKQINSTNICSEDRVNQTNSCYYSLNQRLSEIRDSVSLMAGFSIGNSVLKIVGIPLVWYFGRQLPENYIV